jgi:hypothetical protein
VFALVFTLLALAAVFGCVVLVAGCLLAISSRRRHLGVAILFGGFLGAVAAFGCFTSFVLLVEHGREPLLSQVAGVFSAAGFGVGGGIGASLYVLARGMRIPSRWADRRRVRSVP